VQECDLVANIPELTRAAPAVHRQHQRAAAGDVSRRAGVPARVQYWEYLSVPIGRNLQAEPVDREFQFALRIEAVALRLLHPELCEQRYCGRGQLSYQSVRSQYGLWPVGIRGA